MPPYGVSLRISPNNSTRKVFVDSRPVEQTVSKNIEFEWHDLSWLDSEETQLNCKEQLNFLLPSHYGSLEGHCARVVLWQQPPYLGKRFQIKDDKAVQLQEGSGSNLGHKHS